MRTPVQGLQGVSYGEWVLDEIFLNPAAYHDQKALYVKGIDSMLEDARNDNKDTDTENLKAKCTFWHHRQLRIIDKW